MKKVLVTIFVLMVIILGIFLVFNFLKVKPLNVEDVVEASSSNLVSYVGLGFEKQSRNFESLGELNPTFPGSPWNDNNNFLDGNKYPLMISVSNQAGSVPAQTLSIVYNKENSIQVYVPALSGEGLPWAYFFVSEEGSTYWACATKQPCDIGTLSSKESLKKSNLARKAPA